jgi:hypothetical protein
MNNENNNFAENDNAFFSIRREDMQEDGECFYIRANPAGLKKYANALTKIALDIEEKGESADKKLPNDHWVKGDITLDYLEVVSDNPTENEILLEPQSKETPQSKLFNIGCVATIIVLVLATIVGIVTIVKWL